MKKIITTVLIGTCVSLSAPVFSQSDDALVIWIGGDKGFRGLQQVGDRFTQDLGVAVKVEFPDDASGKFQQAAAAGEGPDILIWAHDRAGEWVQSGLLTPVKPSASVAAQIDEIGWQAFSINGDIYGYPIAYEAVGLVYNTDLIETPPTDFNQIPELHTKLSAEGKSAILWDYANTYFTWPLLAANGGYVFAQDEQGNYNIADTGVNHAGAVKGAELIASMIESGIMPKGAAYSNMEAAMNKGELAMMINGPWSWGNLEKSGINYAVAEIPDVDGQAAKPFVGVLGAMINRASDNADLAVEFIEQYLLTMEGLETVNNDVPLGTPANTALFEKLAAENANIRATMNNVQNGHPMPSVPQMGKFWSSMASALENLTQGRQSAQEALNDAANRIVSE